MTSVDDSLHAWLEVLDELTYYELLGIAPDAGDDDVHDAFHLFCDTFHPDRHVGRSVDERTAVETIFKRATEAFHALSDRALRAQYDEQLASGPSPHPPRISFSPHSRPPSSRAGSIRPLEESARMPSARPFARRAEELVRAGDFRQAKLQLVLANHMDPGNEALEAALRDVEEKLGSPK